MPPFSGWCHLHVLHVDSSLPKSQAQHWTVPPPDRHRKVSHLKPSPVWEQIIDNFSLYTICHSKPIPETQFPSIALEIHMRDGTKSLVAFKLTPSLLPCHTEELGRGDMMCPWHSWCSKYVWTDHWIICHSSEFKQTSLDFPSSSFSSQMQVLPTSLIHWRFSRPPCTLEDNYQ